MSITASPAPSQGSSPAVSRPLSPISAAGEEAPVPGKVETSYSQEPVQLYNGLVHILELNQLQR